MKDNQNILSPNNNKIKVYSTWTDSLLGFITQVIGW